MGREQKEGPGDVDEGNWRRVLEAGRGHVRPSAFLKGVAWGAQRQKQLIVVGLPRTFVHCVPIFDTRYY